MSRKTRAGLEEFLKVDQKTAMTVAVANLLPSNSALTVEQFREGLVFLLGAIYDSMWESQRQSFDILPAGGILAQINGDNPDGQFSITLLNAGQGGIAIDGEDTGYQIIPMITSGSVSGGRVVESAPFDGEKEISYNSTLGDALTLSHKGSITIGGSCLAEITNNASNRQIEVDVMVFDSSNQPERLLGFRTTVNNSNNGRSNSHVVPSVTFQDDVLLPAGSSIALVIRKSALETSNVTVTLFRSFIFANYVALDAGSVL